MDVTESSSSAEQAPPPTQVGAETTASSSATQVAMEVDSSATPATQVPSPTQVGMDAAAETPSKRLRTDEGFRLPTGIRLCIIGGIRGSGKTTISRLLFGDLNTLRVPTEIVDADAFLEPPAHCELCVSLAASRQSPQDYWCKNCRDCPASLDVEPLLHAVLRVAEPVPTAPAFTEAQVGVVIVIGRFALECD